MSTLIIIFLTAILIISIISNYLQYLMIRAGLTREQKFSDIIFNIRNSFQSCLDIMREIDSRQMFEKDDEVGAVFQKLNETIEKTDEQIKNLQK